MKDCEEELWTGSQSHRSDTEHQYQPILKLFYQEPLGKQLPSEKKSGSGDLTPIFPCFAQENETEDRAKKEERNYNSTAPGVLRKQRK